MDVINKINTLMEERNWSAYKLAQMSGLSPSTIANIYRRNTIPSLSTLEAICKAFGISLSQFFADGSEKVELSDEQKNFYKTWVNLTSQQKDLLYQIVKEMK